MQAALLEPTADSSVAALAVRIPADGGQTRVSEIVRLLNGLPSDDSPESRQALSGLEQERRKLHHALTMLKTARQRLHQQYQEHEQEKQDLLRGLRREWNERKRTLDRQLASVAMQKAREELKEERAHLEAEFQQRQMEWEQQHQEIDRQSQAEGEIGRQNLIAERQQFEAECHKLRTDFDSVQTAGRVQDRQFSELKQQLTETRRKLVQTELSAVQEQSQHAAELRLWNDERNQAEAIIRDLMAELESISRSQNRAA